MSRPLRFINTCLILAAAISLFPLLLVNLASRQDGGPGGSSAATSPPGTSSPAPTGVDPSDHASTRSPTTDSPSSNPGSTESAPEEPPALPDDTTGQGPLVPGPDGEPPSRMPPPETPVAPPPDPELAYTSRVDPITVAYLGAVSVATGTALLVLARRTTRRSALPGSREVTRAGSGRSQ